MDGMEMTESEYIAALRERWPEGQTAAPHSVLALATSAVRDYPQSALLWFMRGQLIWMSPYYPSFSDSDYITSFEKAIELDPSFADAYDALGSYHDGIRDDPEKAMEFFRKAAEIRGQPLQ